MRDGGFPRLGRRKRPRPVILRQTEQLELLVPDLDRRSICLYFASYLFDGFLPAAVRQKVDSVERCPRGMEFHVGQSGVATVVSAGVLLAAAVVASAMPAARDARAGMM